ncbi:thiolase family protein [Chloroflexota bacterium]
MRKVSIVGIGIHPFGRFDDETYEEIGLQAARMAMQDARIKWRDIDMAFCSRMYLPATSGVRILTQLGRTGISIVDVEAACASGGAALRQAYLAIASGACDKALVLGVEKMPRGFMDPTQLYEDWQIKMGISQNPLYWAMSARRHMEDYGSTIDQIAKVAVKNHKNSIHNPNAMYRKAFTLEEVLQSRIVNDPIRLLMICAPNEGAAAVVVTAAGIARSYTTKPIQVAASVHKVALYNDWRVPARSMSARVKNPHVTELMAEEAYGTAGIGPEDLDVAEVQDTDAFMEFETYEHLGLCKTGEAGCLIDAGTVEVGGKIPVNTSGGLISKGEPIGASHLGQIYHLVQQLRGELGPTQVPNAKIALAHVTGAGGNGCITILKR